MEGDTVLPSRRAFLRTALAAGAAAGGLAPLISACGGGAATPSPSPSSSSLKRTSIALQLDFLPLGRYAPYYYAVDKGIYDKRGLDVTIATSSGTGPALQQLVAGKAQFLFADIPSMLQLMGKSPQPEMRSYAVVYAKAPETVFYFEGGSIKSPKDLEGKTIATSAGSTDYDLFPLFAKANGIDASTIKWKVVAASAKVSLLLQGQVDATTTFVPGLPGVQAGAKPGQTVGHFTFGDHGVHVYGNGLITTKDFAGANKDAVHAFVQATMEGYRQAFKNPQAAVDSMVKVVPTLKPDQAVAELKIVQDLAMGPAQRQHGLGYQDPTVMKASYDAVVGVLNQPISKPVTELYTNAAL
jgi:NitT/TauT family transport system substrate-binding protein